MKIKLTKAELERKEAVDELGLIYPEGKVEELVSE